MTSSGNQIANILNGLPYESAQERADAINRLSSLTLTNAVINSGSSGLPVLSVSGPSWAHQLVLPTAPLNVLQTPKARPIEIGDLTFSGNAPTGFKDAMASSLARMGWRGATGQEARDAIKSLEVWALEERPGCFADMPRTDLWADGGLFSVQIDRGTTVCASYTPHGASLTHQPLLSYMNPALTAVPGNIQKALEQSVGIAEMLRRPAQNQNLLNIVVGSRDHLADFVDLLGKLSKAVAKLSTHLLGGGNQTVPEPVARVRLRNIISALGVPEMAMKEGRLDGSLGSVRLTPQERKGTPAVQAIKSLLEARGVTLSVDSKNNLERIVSGPPLASFYGRCLGTNGSHNDRAGIFSWCSTESGKYGEWRTVALLPGTKSSPFTYEMCQFEGNKLVGLSSCGKVAVQARLKSLEGFEIALSPSSVTLTDEATADELIRSIDSHPNYPLIGGTSEELGRAREISSRWGLGAQVKTIYHKGTKQIQITDGSTPKHVPLPEMAWGMGDGPSLDRANGLAVELKDFQVPPLSRSEIARMLGCGEKIQREKESSPTSTAPGGDRASVIAHIANLFAETGLTDVVRTAEANLAVLNFFSEEFFEPLCDILEDQAKSWRESGVPEWEIRRKIEEIGKVLPWPTISQVTSAIKAKEQGSTK